MSGEEGSQVIQIDDEEHDAPHLVEPQPAHEPVQVVVIDSDSDSEDDPEEELFVNELEEILENNAAEDAEQVNHEMEDALVQLGGMVHYLMDQNIDLNNRLQTSENRAQYFEAQVHGVQADYHELQNQRTADLQRHELSDQRVRNLEHALRTTKARMENMNCAYTTSMERIQEAVWTYPNEMGQFRRSISRARVIAITEDERVGTSAGRE